MIRFWLLMFFLISSNTGASWDGPFTILSESWGSEKNQFGLEGDAVYYELPGAYSIGDGGFAALADNVNNRLKIYKSDGELVQIFAPNELSKGFNVLPFILDDRLVALVGGTAYFLSKNGELLNKVSFSFDYEHVYIDGQFLYFSDRNNRDWIALKASGEFFESPGHYSIESPIRSTVSGSNVYKTEILYKGDTLNLVGQRFCDEFYKHDDYYICRNDRVVDIFNACGRELERFVLPEDIEREIRPDFDGIDGEIEIEKQYLPIVLSNNLDVYAALRTPDAYSLLKWTWKDDAMIEESGPFPPPYLEAKNKLNKSFLDLTWIGSLQDPGCVTEYKIFRTETEENIEKQIGTVSAGVEIYRDTSVEAGKEYTYRLKAASSLGDSEFSDSVTVTVPE